MTAEVPDYFSFSIEKETMELDFARRCIEAAEARPGPPIIWRHTPMGRLPDARPS